MRGLLSLLIFTMLLKSMYGQLLYDDFGEQQKCVNVATHIINEELRQLTKSMERMVKQNMEGMKNLDANNRNLKSDLQKLVELQKEANDNSTNIIGDKLTCSGSLTPSSGTDCADILKKYPDTRGKDGVYTIVDLSRTKAVYCDMTTENGGWTVIQRRVNGSVNFYRNWTQYKNGFGFADHKYWIGTILISICIKDAIKNENSLIIKTDVQVLATAGEFTEKESSCMQALCGNSECWRSVLSIAHIKKGMGLLFLKVVRIFPINKK